jgi:acetate kinase
MNSNSDEKDQYVLCLNTGSSSLKFSLYGRRNLESAIMSGSADKIGLQKSHLRIQVRGRLFFDEDIPLPSHEKAVIESFAALRRAQLPIPVACVHRVVHGGPRLLEPCLINEGVQRELESLIALAPLHIPSELAVIKATTHAYPNTPQIACFDTTFHQRMPDVAKRLPLSKILWEQGIRRYGFHGLSYESIVSQLQNQLKGRTIIAHLGNGCSMVALRDGVPQDTTMGLTPTGGLMMGTRSGDLDPGVLFYLLRSLPSKTPDVVGRAEQTVNDESGLLGISGISRNMEELLKAETDSPAAREAIELFCYQAVKFIGSLYAVLGGLEKLVFTGGIGENSTVIRQRICKGLNFLDLGQEASSCQVRVLQTNENFIMATHALRILSQASSEVTRLSS